MIDSLSIPVYSLFLLCWLTALSPTLSSWVPHPEIKHLFKLLLFVLGIFVNILKPRSGHADFKVKSQEREKRNWLLESFNKNLFYDTFFVYMQTQNLLMVSKLIPETKKNFSGRKVKGKTTQLFDNFDVVSLTIWFTVLTCCLDI